MSSTLTSPEPLTQHRVETLKKPSLLQLRVDEIYLGPSEGGNIWQSQDAVQVTTGQLSEILKSPLFTEVKVVEISGKQPVYCPALVEQVRVLVSSLPNLSRLELVTPVSDGDQAIEAVAQIGAIAQTQSILFTVRLLLPSPEVASRQPQLQSLVSVIDAIRNRDWMAELKLECLVNKSNVYQIHDWLEFALAHNVPIVYTLDVLWQLASSTNVSLDFEEKYHLAIFLENAIGAYETDESQIRYYRSLIGQLMYGEPRRVQCQWQPGGVTLSASGDLFYCAVQSQPLGSVLEKSPDSLYEDNWRHFTEIRQTKCATCTQGCRIPLTSEPVSKVPLQSFWQRSIQSVKSLKVFQPLKTLKGQLAFQHSLKNLGITQDNLSMPKPTPTFRTSKPGKRKVLICGWYGTETLGDKAILGGVVQGLREALGELELHLVALEIYISQMTVLQMPELQGCALHSVADALGMVQDMDLVVFGGGPLMAIGVMAEMLAIFQRAVAAQIPTLLAGCGVGPLGASFFNDAIKQVLLHSSYRIYRDQKSLEIARSLGVDVSRDLVAEDPAFTWLASRTEPFSRDNRSRALESPRLLLGLRDWPYHEFAAEMGTFEAERLKLRFEEELVAGLERLVEGHPTLTIIPFPMCTNHLGFDDRWFYRRLFRDRSKFKDVLDLSYLGRELSPDEAISVFQSATAALTMRFHSLIFALSNGVPSVAIDYTLGRGKVKALAEKYRVPYMGLDTINAEFIASSLSPLLAGEPSDSVVAFREGKLTFKDAVKSFVVLMQTGRK
jgi:polysaccharide pyruvyl transferase WcaK-like protein